MKKHNILQICLACVVAAMVVLSAMPTQAQTPKAEKQDPPVVLKSGHKIGIGLSPLWILNTPAADLITVFNGGGFAQAQLGAVVRFRYALDTTDTWRVTGGGEYHFLRGRHRVSFPNADALSSNELDVLALSAGVEYAPIRVLDIVQPYIGLDIRYTSVNSGLRRNQFVQRTTGEILQEFSFPQKERAGRLGSSIRLGAEGILADNIVMDFAVTASAVNLFGRDDARGEFFTTDRDVFEPKETMVSTLQFTMTLFYRL